MKKAMMLSIMVFLSTNVAAVALADSTIGSEVSLAVDFAPNLGSDNSFQGIMTDEGAMDLAADRTRTRTRDRKKDGSCQSIMIDDGTMDLAADQTRTRTRDRKKKGCSQG